MAQTVAEMIAELERLDPRSIILWHPQTSCVAETAKVFFKPVKVREIKDDRYSLIGEPREKKTRAVLMDVRDAE
ncbi:MAG: hypothetical protein AB7J28_15755 [Hyphomonadaceae bacterium]